VLLYPRPVPKTPSQISELVEDFVGRLTAAIEESAVARVRAAFDGAVGSAAAGRKATRPVGRPPGKQPLSPARAKALKLQGKYISTLRRLKGADRAKVKAAAQAKGVAEALKIADKIK